MADDAVLRVAVPGPLARLFDYLPPADATPAPVGARVRVPFGRSRRVGVIAGSAVESDVPRERLRPVAAVLDAEPVLPDDLMALGRWAARYYHHPPGEVFAGMLPAPLRRGETPDTSAPPHWRATAAGRAALAEGLRGAPAQARLLALIAAYPEDGVDEASLKSVASRLREPLRALAGKGLVEQVRAPAREPGEPEPGPPLNDEQRAAVDAIAAADGFAPFLLQGVTGSGKTEVYLALIERAIAAGRQALVLVPEIGLTPQLLARFAARVAAPIAVLHSGLADNERLAAWRSAASGEARLVLGTRSAVFTPLPRPGLFICDEEHDPSFKQQEGWRYHARDLAVVRAQRAGVPVVLGSATPSLESLANVEAGTYRRVRLDERAGGARPPRLELVDVRRRRLAEGLSRPLMEAMDEHLAADGQVLLFINRRGWSPTLICDDCGWVAECTRCDARLTVHRRSERLRCHHCGAERRIPPACPDCGSEALVHLGQGTERVADAVAERFPDVEAVRIDRDSTRRRGALDGKLERVRAGQARILLGTQMLAKGHDFPGVTLVGILDADRGLFGADFRAPEHLAQTILQVAGRAGRGDRPGRVLIQTRNPEHPMLRGLVESGFDAVAETLLAERRESRWPPATRMALVRAEATRADAPTACLEAARDQLAGQAPAEVEVLGPAPAPMERIAGRYRAQLLLQAPARRPLHVALDLLRPWLETDRAARRVRWSIDVDPVEAL